MQYVKISVPVSLNKNSIFLQATFVIPPIHSLWISVQVTFFISENVFTKKETLINSCITMYFHDYFPRKCFWRLIGSKGGRKEKTMCTIGLCSKELLLAVPRRHSSFGHSPLCHVGEEFWGLYLVFPVLSGASAAWWEREGNNHPECGPDKHQGAQQCGVAGAYIPTAATGGVWDASHHLTWSRPHICAVSYLEKLLPSSSLLPGNSQFSLSGRKPSSSIQQADFWGTSDIFTVFLVSRLEE